MVFPDMVLRLLGVGSFFRPAQRPGLPEVLADAYRLSFIRRFGNSFGP